VPCVRSAWPSSDTRRGTGGAVYQPARGAAH
jgi:hypothetical protein